MSLRQSADLCSRWHGKDDGRLRYAFTPRFAITCSPEMLRESAALAASTGAYWQTHLSEDHDELDEVARLFPEAIDYLDVYDRAGGLGPRTILAHAIHLSDREIGRLAESGAAVAHCPASNLFLSSGAMPLSRSPRGIRVGLGSDVAGGPELSIFANMRAGAYTQSGLHVLADGRGPEPLEPLDWLRLATLGGAQTLGMDAEIGSLEPGKEADMIATDPASSPRSRGSTRTTPRRSCPGSRSVSTPTWSGSPGSAGGASTGRPGSRDRLQMTRRVDLLLEGGTIVDGTGAPGMPGSVAVVGDRIVLPSPGEAVEAARVIDVSGHVVAPGFIDLHSHGGLVILAEPRHEPRSARGSRRS